MCSRKVTEELAHKKRGLHPHVKLAIQKYVECGDRKQSTIYNRLTIDKVHTMLCKPRTYHIW